jgi:large repetitive protein
MNEKYSYRTILLMGLLIVGVWTIRSGSFSDWWSGGRSTFIGSSSQVRIQTTVHYAKSASFYKKMRSEKARLVKTQGASPDSKSVQTLSKKFPEKEQITAFAGAKILQVKNRAPDSKGVRERVKLLETSFKYPLIRVVESVKSDPSGQEVVAQQVEMVADHIIVKVHPRVKKEAFTQLAQRLKGSIRKTLSVPNTYLVSFQAKDVDTIDQMIRTFKQNTSMVAVVEPDYVAHASLTPNDPYFTDQWALDNTGQLGGVVDADVDSPAAWSLHTGTKTVKIGVIDSGVDYNHPDLAANIWVNTGEIASNGVDDDGNGRIDDVRGWDFINGDNDPMDDYYHGTHCSGILGGIGNNAQGIAGVAWNVTIIPLKAFNGSTGVTSSIIEAVNYATQQGVLLTSNSWNGSGYSELLRQAIIDADANGILFVASSGNSSSDLDSVPDRTIL